MEIETCSNSAVTANPQRGRAPSPAARPPGGAGCSTRRCSSRRRVGSTRCRCATSRPQPTSRSAPCTATSRRRSGCCSRRWPSSSPICARYLEVHPPTGATAAERVGQRCCGARTGRCARIPTSPRRWCGRSAPRRPENADIVRRVTEIMTAIITQRDPRARCRARPPSVSCGSRASSCRCGCRR